MKKTFLLLTISIAFLFFSAGKTFAQGFPYQEYKTRNISELIEKSSELNDYKAKQSMISASPFYSAVRVKYAGKFRSISDEKKALFKLWQEALSINKDVLPLLENEYLFIECGKEYWIPVQKQVAAYFSKELKDNDTITLYLMVVGGVKLKDSWDFVFLVNEFDKY